MISTLPNKFQSKIKILLSKKKFTESDCLYLLSLIRKQLEFHPRDTFANLKLFCDWSLHGKIDRSSSGFKLVEQIHITLNFVKNKDTDTVISEISNTLLDSFRSDLKTFLDEVQVNTSIVDDPQQWICFLRNVLEIIEMSPVAIKSTEMEIVKANPLKSGMWVEQISVIKTPAIEFGKPCLSEQLYCLQILTSDTTRVVIPIMSAI